jgi:hypothetical protein
MIITQGPSDDGALGFSITSPFKKIGHAVAKGARATGHAAVAVGKTTGHVAIKAGKTVAKYDPGTRLAIYTTKKLGNLALAPVRHRIDRLKDRRAKKLAWDRRKSKEPTAAERAEARAWTKSYLKKHPPHGTMLALLAGPPGFFDPDPAMLGVAPAVAAAAVPVLIALMDRLLGKASASGQAPSNPGEAPLPSPEQVAAVTNAAAAAADGAAAAAATAPDGGDTVAADGDAGGDAGGRGAVAPASGKGSAIGGIPKKYLMIGGAVLGAVVLISVLKK